MKKEINTKVRIKYDLKYSELTTLDYIRNKWIKDGERSDWIEGVIKLLQDRGHVTIRGILYQIVNQ